MKKRFSIKRAIILLSIVLVYSVALCFISVLAKKSMLNDITFNADSAQVISDEVGADDASANQSEVSTPHYYDAASILEDLEKKDQYDNYGIFAPVTTQVPTDENSQPSRDTESVTTAPEPDATKPTTPSPAETEQPKTTQAQTTAATTTAPESEKQTTTTSEEDIVIDDDEESDDEVSLVEEDDEDVVINDEDVIIEDEEKNEEVEDTVITPDMVDKDYIQSLIEKYYEQLQNDPWGSNSSGNPWGTGSTGASEPQYYPNDNLVSTKSYADDIVTIYDKTTGRYVTDNAFDLVCQITYNEIGTSMHPEAIKAQAVAAYSYIKHYQQKGEYASISTKADPPQLIIDCVRAVDGLAMYYDDKYIMAAFSASTGGVTCSSENVWGGERPYLVSVVNEYDYLDTKNYGRVTTYTVDELRKKIESKTDIKLSDNYENWIQILSYADGNYVDRIAIDGHTTAEVSGKERELTAYVFRTYILSIRSTCFTVSYENGVFTFVTYGYGHGVGMSQIGADLYAEIGGYTFDQILHHYYTGITIK